MAENDSATPYLGDYLGHLLSEITIARLQADLEAIRVAELYSSHPLLRHFPIPHFRLPTVTIEVPVVIKGVAGTGTARKGRDQGPSIANLRKTFEQVLATRLSQAEITLTRAGSRYLRTRLDDILARFATPIPGMPMPLLQVADELAAAARTAFAEGELTRSAVKPETLDTLADDLKQATRPAFLNLMPVLPRLQVAATTQEVRDAGPANTIGKILLSVSEEGVQWTSVETSGESKDRLVPE
jgi:hypothetical protein